MTDDRRRKQRLEVLNRVFRHNIRNAMNAVVGPADVLAERVDEEDRELAETVTRGGREILDLAESIRDVEETVTRPIDPTAVEVDRVAEDCVGDAPAGVETSLTCSGDCTVRTDPRTLSLALGNAVDNAFKHGSGTESAKNGEPDDGAADRVSITVERHERGCLLSVEDDGPGIPEEELDVLRAGTETPLSHGSGVGLWAIRWGVTRIDGAVGFDTDDGTTVALWVPDLPDGGTASAAETPPEIPGVDWFGRNEPAPAAVDGPGAAAASGDATDD
ncbi:MAG: sensor histidine kinase [Halosimplex sp.]